jgi:hypothetical protein
MLATALSFPAAAWGQAKAAATPAAPAKATATEARAFVEKAEKRLTELSIKYAQADWVSQNFITEDTAALSAGELRASVKNIWSGT